LINSVATSKMAIATRSNWANAPKAVVTALASNVPRKKATKYSSQREKGNFSHACARCPTWSAS